MTETQLFALVSVKLSELPYTVWSVAPVSVQMEDRLLNPPAADESCIQIGLKHKGNQSEECGGQKQCHSGGKFEVNKESQLFGQSIYIDFDVSAELHSKVSSTFSLVMCKYS